MSVIKLNSDPRVKQKLDAYPRTVQECLWNLRQLILNCAEEMSEVTRLEETLKWGEPSYLTKTGSTIRMDWKPDRPEHYSLFFKCTSRLVPTFRKLYPDLFHYEGNRELRFELSSELPSEQLKLCIQAALRYHKVKDLPDLNIDLRD